MKVVICGAGLAGLTLAQRLDTLGWDVVVLEKAPGPRSQGYMIDFFGVGYDAAEAMGVLPRIQELGYHVDEVSFLDETGRRRAALPFGQVAKSVGGRLLSIMRPDLELALRESLSAAVDLRFATSLTSVEQGADSVRVTLTDGGTLDADLLVGADGIHSAVRGLVFGEESNYLRYLGFHTAAFSFDDPAIHADLRNRFCLTDTIDRQLGLYGLRGGRVAAYAVHRTPDRTLPVDARAAVLREYGSLGWIVPRVLGQCPPTGEVYYDLVAQIEMPTWSHGRVTLIGDACQAVSLLAGQGASLAIAGAYLLADQLVTAGSIEDALARYEQLWRPVVLEKQLTGRKGIRWFVPASLPQVWIRRLAMRFTRISGIDRLIAGTLAGKSSTIIRQLHQSDGVLRDHQR
ncbi:MAG TPA: FAD-dependent monooxygenase [Pseudonocardiaceae bacterium]|jgi:2-polyprenyl-6-methoxyphenol hydroxylase-like FAD-dependent oxidoreductase